MRSEDLIRIIETANLPQDTLLAMLKVPLKQELAKEEPDIEFIEKLFNQATGKLINTASSALMQHLKAVNYKVVDNLEKGISIEDVKINYTLVQLLLKNGATIEKGYIEVKALNRGNKYHMTQYSLLDDAI